MGREKLIEALGLLSKELADGVLEVRDFITIDVYTDAQELSKIEPLLSRNVARAHSIKVISGLINSKNKIDEDLADKMYRLVKEDLEIDAKIKEEVKETIALSKETDRLGRERRNLGRRRIGIVLEDSRYEV